MERVKARKQRQAAPRSRALHELDIVTGLREVPQTGELAHVEQARLAYRLQDAQVDV